MSRQLRRYGTTATASPGSEIQWDRERRAHYVDVHFKLGGDYRDTVEKIKKLKAIYNGRSGVCRGGLDPVFLNKNRLTAADVRPDGSISGRVYCYLPEPLKTRVLDRVMAATDEAPLHLGHAVDFSGMRSLSKRAVLRAIKQHQLWIPKGSRIHPDGSISIPIADCVYSFDQSAFTNGNIDTLLRHGKHPLDEMQALARGKRPKQILPGEFLVTGVQIALGGLIAVIDPGVSVDVIHLSANIFDERTMGYEHPFTGAPVYRQLELYNFGRKPRRVKCIKIKIYPGDPKFSALADIMTANALRYGLNVRHILFGHGHLIDSLFTLFGQAASANHRALFLAGGRMLVCDNSKLSEQVAAAEKIVRNENDSAILRNGQVDSEIQPLLSALELVDGHQNSGRIAVFFAPPTQHHLDQLMRKGMRTFIIFSDRGVSSGNYSEDWMNQLSSQGAHFVWATTNENRIDRYQYWGTGGWA